MRRWFRRKPARLLKVEFYWDDARLGSGWVSGADLARGGNISIRLQPDPGQIDAGRMYQSTRLLVDFRA